jgi:hypothetical protein
MCNDSCNSPNLNLICYLARILRHLFHGLFYSSTDVKRSILVQTLRKAPAKSDQVIALLDHYKRRAILKRSIRCSCVPVPRLPPTINVLVSGTSFTLWIPQHQRPCCPAVVVLTPVTISHPHHGCCSLTLHCGCCLPPLQES